MMSPTEGETRVPRQLNPFTKDMVDPFPDLRFGKVPKGKRGRYEVVRQNYQAPRLELTDELQKVEIEKSTVGKVATMNSSTGFLDSQSEQQRAQNQHFDHDVIEAFRQGRERELDIARQRKEINNTANLASLAPPPMKSTAHASHPNLLPAVDRSANDHCHTRARGKQKAFAHDRGTQQRETNFTETYNARNEAMNDIDALTAYYQEQLALQKAASPEKMKGTFTKFSHVGGPPRTTYKAHHDEIDAVACAQQMDGTAKSPVLHKSQQIEAEDDQAHVDRILYRKANRFTDEFQTTVSTNFEGKQLNADQKPPPGNSKGHVFEYINGTLQMRKAHEPLRKADNWDRTTNTATINPNQYTTMKTLWERMAVAGLDHE